MYEWIRNEQSLRFENSSLVPRNSTIAWIIRELPPQEPLDIPDNIILGEN